MIAYKQWGIDIDTSAIQQMENACSLPVSVAAALMPDAHQGYGLPIGGVLATDNAVIPYAVGMDIACRMKISVFDLPVSDFTSRPEKLKKALLSETLFGVGAAFSKPMDHPVMDEDWSVSPVTRMGKEKAWSQLGTSGSGNHFAEFGILALEEPAVLWSTSVPVGRHVGKELPAGEYVAFLTHAGSRGIGGQVATHYSRLASKFHPELPKELSALAWLDVNSDAGREYWWAMELMGRYAAAGHELVHRRIRKYLKADVLGDVENHHNFAWREEHFGREVIVHRKGATPAFGGMLGVIPGSMTAPGFVVIGKGEPSSLNSAAHGAGRSMSRKAALLSFTQKQVKAYLDACEVTLLSAGLDEAPMAYKDIEEVMAAQEDLVTSIARFDPKIVRMAGPKD